MRRPHQNQAILLAVIIGIILSLFFLGTKTLFRIDNSDEDMPNIDSAFYSEYSGGDESESSYAASEPEEELKSNAEEQIKSETFKEYLLDGKNVETVLGFHDGNDIFRMTASKETIAFASTKDDDGERKAASIIEEYLRARGVFSEKPDDINFVDDICSIEHYTDSGKQRHSVIMRLLDASNGYFYVFATTYSLDDFTELGNIVFDCNLNGDVISEKFYNSGGELTSDVTYQYYENIPFPFVSKHTITDESCYGILNRGQRFWFYEEFAAKGETGEIAGYTQDIYHNDDRDTEDGYSIRFAYDAAGRLDTLSEDFIAEDDDPFHEEDWTSDILSLEYYGDGAIKKVDYRFETTFSYELPQNSRNRGTWYSSGKIYYDKYGRAVYRSDYVTHGSHSSFYLYDGDLKRPWACIELCSMSYDSKENYGYGNETSVLLYSAAQ